MIITVRKGNTEPKEKCYLTVCDGCNTKFVFDDDKFVTCPSSFKKIPQWRCNRFMKKYM